MNLLHALVAISCLVIPNVAVAPEAEEEAPQSYIINDNLSDADPTIYVIGLMTEEGAMAFGQAVLAETIINGHDHINMVIDSPGGVVIAGFMMADIMKESGAHFSCTVKGEAASMAFYLLQACDERFMTADSVLLAHEPAITARLTPTEMKKALKDLKDMAKRMAKEESAKLKVSLKVFNKKTRGQDWIMDAGIALEVGAVDKIIPGNKNIDLDRNYLEACFEPPSQVSFKTYYSLVVSGSE